MQTLAYEALAGASGEGLLQGTYRLVRQIGAGGMGEVWEATHARLPGRFAVKILLRHLLPNKEALARFSREAAIMADLRHPHIVQVFDYNTTTSGVPYFVMEYLEGIDLGARLDARGKLPLEEAIAIVKQVASGLAAAHARGVVHRDLKPQNIFLCEVEGEKTEFVKILDFGISKVRSTSNQLSLGAHIFGTPQFMAPEQALGRLDDIDGRTDQFALATLTFTMLTGETPYVGEDPASLLYQVVHEPAKRLPGLVPFNAQPIQVVLDRALEKDPRRRFGSIIEFSSALEEAAAFAADSRSTAVPLAARRPRTMPGPLHSTTPSPMRRQPQRTEQRQPEREPQPQSTWERSSRSPSEILASPEAARVLAMTPRQAITKPVFLDAEDDRDFFDEDLDRVPQSPLRAIVLAGIAVALVGTLVAKGWHREVIDSAQFLARSIGPILRPSPISPPAGAEAQQAMAPATPPETPPTADLPAKAAPEAAPAPRAEPSAATAETTGARTAPADTDRATEPRPAPVVPEPAAAAAPAPVAPEPAPVVAEKVTPRTRPSSRGERERATRSADIVGELNRSAMDRMMLPSAPQASPEQPILTPHPIEPPIAEPPSPPSIVPTPATPVADPDAPVPPADSP